MGERPSFTDNPLRVTKREAPAPRGSKLDITAGWNGNLGSYYFIVVWTEDVGDEVKAGDIYLEGCPPWNRINDIADLAEHLMGEIDLSSPDLTAVFFNLMCDKSRDIANFHYFENPYRNEPILDLVGKVLDRDFTPVVPADKQ